VGRPDMTRLKRLNALIDPALRRMPRPALRTAAAVVAVVLAADVVVPDVFPLIDELGLGVLLWRMLDVLRERPFPPPGTASRPAAGVADAPPRATHGGTVDATRQGVTGTDRPRADGRSTRGPLVHAPLDREVWRVDARIRACRRDLAKRHGLPAAVEARLRRLEEAAAEEQRRLKRMESLLEGPALDPWRADRDLEKATAALGGAATAATRAQLAQVHEAARARRDQVAAVLECRDLAAARLLEIAHRVADLHARLALLDLADPEEGARLQAAVDEELQALERVPEELVLARQEVAEAIRRRPGRESTALAKALDG